MVLHAVGTHFTLTQRMESGVSTRTGSAFDTVLYTLSRVIMCYNAPHEIPVIPST
jgi:hypothetical protein